MCIVMCLKLDITEVVVMLIKNKLNIYVQSIDMETEGQICLLPGVLVIQRVLCVIQIRLKDF